MTFCFDITVFDGRSQAALKTARRKLNALSDDKGDAMSVNAKD